MGELERPKWGTCEDCRWDDDGTCFRVPPQVYFERGEHSGVLGDDMMRAMQPGTFETMSCGEWEPPEGKVCGNCVEWLKDAMCPHGQARDWILAPDDYDTCPAWRWEGPSDG